VLKSSYKREKRIGKMSEKSKIGIEIEKKYIIKMPNPALLQAQERYDVSRIVQIYLPCATGETLRIRSREQNGITTYTKTRKIRIDKMSSTEIEKEISAEEFDSLSRQILSTTRPIMKTRYTFIYKSQLFEIDVYPEWTRTAIMETELDSRERTVDFPEFLKIVKDVTGDKSYSNRGMSQTFPKEQL